MDFREFFRKKRIDLIALEKAEPALFSEFKTHYEEMGEKSFDHTKKYWFNKTRRQFPLAPEIKSEKPHIANPLAEQTITESLAETSNPSAPAKTGFIPRFKAAIPPLPSVDADEKAAEHEVRSPAPKSEFTPRFKPPASSDPVQTFEKDKPIPVPLPPKPGFTPRFKAGITNPVESTEEKPDEPEISAPPPSPKPGFTPRFKAGLTKPAEKAAKDTVSDPTPKPAFTPGFKAGLTKPGASDDSKPADDDIGKTED